MDYTLANSNVVHAGTGQRMHLQAQAVPTQVTDVDMNALLWSNMELLKAAGLSGQQFDPAVPASYTKLRDAIRMLSLSKRLPITANTTLTAADAGSTVHASGSAALTATLPAAAACQDAVRINFVNNSTQQLSIARQGADTMLVGYTLGLTVFAMPVGSTCCFVLNKAAGIWIAEAGSAMDAYNSLNAGLITWHAASTPPAGKLKANGALVSRVSFPALFARIGITFGAGDGSTTYGLPDFRGEFVRGWDDGRGIDAGRAFASLQLDDFKSHNHALSSKLVGSGAAVDTANNVGGGWGITASTGGTETRPRNIALLACIDY
jgi:microcystin-dependent protein